MFRISRVTSVLFLLSISGVAMGQNLPYNRFLGGIQLATVDGKQVVEVVCGLRLGEYTAGALDLSTELEVSIDGTVFDVLPLAIKTAPAGGAITCAVTCSGACPSIFGDGTCTGCGCDYSDSYTIPVDPDAARPGAVISARMVAVRPGAVELDTSDDVARLVVPRKPTEVFVRGDVNANGKVDIADAISQLSCLFSGGDCSSCQDAADANDDGRLDMSDPIFELSWLFLGGSAPPAPGPFECGADLTPDSLAPCATERTSCQLTTE